MTSMESVSPVQAARRADQGMGPDGPYLASIQQIPVRPIFIMGDHRSGTTLLYRLLDASGAFNVLRAYHIIAYDALLDQAHTGGADAAQDEIRTQLAAAGMANRRLDEVPAAPDSPEEYGFLLRDGARPRLTQRTLPRLVEACRKVQAISDPAKPLLLKNPWDFANFVFVQDAFPDARFIFLHRHPVHVINSQIAAARTLYAAKSVYHALLDPDYDRLWQRPVRLAATRFLFSPRMNMGFRIALRHVRRATAYFLDHLPHLDAARYMETSYEALCADPAATLARILRFAGVAAAVPQQIAGTVRPRRPSLLPEVARRKPEIAAQLQPYYAHCGYAAEPA